MIRDAEHETMPRKELEKLQLLNHLKTWVFSALIIYRLSCCQYSLIYATLPLKKLKESL